MRRIGILCLTLLFVIACGHKKEEKHVQKKKEEKPEMVEPLNPENPTAPTMIKAIRDAKEVKKEIDARRQEDSQVLKEQN